MTDLSRIRISDADRNAVIDRLQRATAEGRLDLDELDDRIAAALTARTWSDVDVLIDDLPAVDEPEPDESPAARPAAGGAGPLITLGAGAVALAGSFWSPWGALLGLVSAVLGTILLLGPRDLSRGGRAAVLLGMILGLLPFVFFVTVLAILDQ